MENPTLPGTETAVFRHRIHELYRDFKARQDPLGCFDALYAESGNDIQKIPWARQKPNPCLVAWQKETPPGVASDGRKALVVGCGLGDDAEFLAKKGWQVTAFDLSLHAIDWARRRFPRSKVTYLQADLFKLPPSFYRGFDFVFESNTVQSIPLPLREEAVCAIAGTVGLGGRLLAVPRGRNEGEPLGAMPWPFSRTELRLFQKYDLRETFFADRLITHADGPVRIFQAEYRRVEPS